MVCWPDVYAAAMHELEAGNTLAGDCMHQRQARGVDRAEPCTSGWEAWV